MGQNTKIIGEIIECKNCKIEIKRKAYRHYYCDKCFIEKKSEWDRKYRLKNVIKMKERKRKEYYDNPKAIEKLCAQCNKKYKRPKNVIGKYCGRKCSDVASRAKRKCKGNPAYKDGDNSRERRINEMKNGISFCQQCGKHSQLDAHHIIYRSEAPRHINLHDERNLIVICRSCHAYFHKSKAKNREVLIKERKLWELFPELYYLKP